jgi:outer membrane protein OmpA-like peptidoglycan-associated protein
MSGFRINPFAAGCFVIVMLAAAPVPAQKPCAGSLNADQIRDCLAPTLKTRGIKRGIAVQGDPAPAEETTVNLVVNFDFNSAHLSNDGMIALDALGKALSDPVLREERFRIEGHTDAVGSDAYNQKLSEARAAAVRAYLAQNFALDPARFEVLGLGKSQLYDASDPTAAINRRVQVTKLVR